MGKALVIPDVHLKPWIINRASALMDSGVYDHAIFLGDFVDDWGQEDNIGLYNETFDALLAFVNKHRLKTFICWGNHDMSYIWGRRETGYSYMARLTVQERIREIEKALNGNYYHADYMQRTAYMCQIGKVLFSHGGLVQEFITEYIADWDDNGPVMPSVQAMIDAVNRMGPDPLWEENSPLWARPGYYHNSVYTADGTIFQVVGHTPVKVPQKYPDRGCMVTDVFSTDRSGNPLGTQELVVIDTDTLETELIYIGKKRERTGKDEVRI